MTRPSPLTPILHQPPVPANDRPPSGMQGTFAAGLGLASRSRPLSTRSLITVAAVQACGLLGSAFRRLAGLRGRSVRTTDALSVLGTPRVVARISPAYLLRLSASHVGPLPVEDLSTTGASACASTDVGRIIQGDRR